MMGAMFAVFSSMFFTGKVIVAKLAYARGIDPLGMVLLRMVFASPFFIVMLLVEYRRGARASIKDILLSVFLGMLSYYLASILDFTGIQYISTALERMILQLSPSFVVLIGFLFLGQKLERRLLTAIGIGYLGIALMVYSEMGESVAEGHVAQSWIGVLCIVGATLSFSIYVLGADRVMHRMGSKLFTSCAMSGACFAVFVHYLLVRGPVAPTHDGVVYSLGLAMGIFCTVLPSFMVNRAIQLIGGQRIGPFNYLGMGLTFVASSFVLSEVFSVMKLAGILLAACGALSLTMGRIKPAAKVSELEPEKA